MEQMDPSANNLATKQALDKMSELIDLSLVLPCFNETAVFMDSVKQIFDTLDTTCWTYEVIFIDDKSVDQTRELIDQVIRENPQRNLHRIFHQRNKGRGGTVSDGLHASRGRVAGYIDIDLEVHARYIPSMMLAIQSGADIATAQRIYKLYWRGWVRFLASHGYLWLEHWMLGVPLKDTETGFKFFRREKILPVLDEIEDEGWFWDTEIMVRSFLQGLKIVEIPCLFHRHFDKHSTVNVVSDSLDYFVKLWRFRKTVAQIPSRK